MNCETVSIIVTSVLTVAAVLMGYVLGAFVVYLAVRRHL